jgi:hypothetical protein
MKKNLIVSVLFLIAAISSCKKDVVEYPITYSSNSISEPTIKVYTRNGEVTSTALVNNIISRYQSNLNKLEDDKIKERIVITYISEDSTEITIDKIREDKLRSVHEIGGVIYLEKQDTTIFPFGPLFKVQDLNKYYPLYYTETPAPTASGYSTYARFKDCFFLIKNGGKLKIPMFDFFWIFKSGYLRSIPEINNSFKEAGLNNFFVNDTMIIQEYLVEMK